MAHIAAKSGSASAADIYLAEIGQYPLLSAQEEIELAVQYERGQAAERELVEPASDDGQRRHELEQTAKRGEYARRRLIECNLRLVVNLAKRYLYLGLPFDDLVQEANMGLMKAVERYDHQRGIRFATYAGWWIHQAVMRAACRARVIPFPAWMYDALVRLRRVRQALESQLVRSPTLDELADEMQEPAHKIRRMLEWDQEILSLQMPIGEYGEGELGDVIPDHETPPVEGTVAQRLLLREVQDAMAANLDPRDCDVLHMRFGLDGGGERTLEQVAQVYGITRERARQLEKRALKRLRRTGNLHQMVGT